MQGATTRQADNMRESGRMGKEIDRKNEAGRQRYEGMEIDRSRQGEEGTEMEAAKAQNRQTRKALKTDIHKHPCMQADNIVKAKVGR
jgi:hypothetical protein